MTFNIVELVITGLFCLLVGWSLPKIERKDKQ